MSLIRAIERAYRITRERNYNTIYWAVDLHGTVITSNYETGIYQYISEDAKQALQSISALPETKLILWSSMHMADKYRILQQFEDDGIDVRWFNENRDEQSNKVSCFDEKFYFSILVDDKAGFDPAEWPEITAKTLALSKEFHNVS